MSRFGTFLFGATEFLRKLVGGSRFVACVGDPATHPGLINFSGQDGSVKAGGAVVAVLGSTFSCAIPGHGTTPIYPIIKKTYINGKLIITAGARSGCGAMMNPPNRGVKAG